MSGFLQKPDHHKFQFASRSSGISFYGDIEQTEVTLFNGRDSENLKDFINKQTMETFTDNWFRTHAHTLEWNETSGYEVDRVLTLNIYVEPTEIPIEGIVGDFFN